MKKITNVSVNDKVVVLTIQTTAQCVVNNQITTRTTSYSHTCELLYEHDDTLVVYVNGKDSIVAINKNTHSCELLRDRIHMHSY